MALPAHRAQSNIQRTVQVRLGDNLVVGATSYRVIHDYPFVDVDAVRDDNTTPLAAYIGTTWLDGGAGRRGASYLQCDIFTRVKGEATAGGDKFGHVASGIADALVSLFSGARQVGDNPAPPGRRAFFHVLDFSVPSNPVDTGECMLCINSRGDIGEPEDNRALPNDRGFRRHVVRFRFILAQDGAGPAAHYTQ